MTTLDQSLRFPRYWNSVEGTGVVTYGSEVEYSTSKRTSYDGENNFRRMMDRKRNRSLPLKVRQVGDRWDYGHAFFLDRVTAHSLSHRGLNIATGKNRYGSLNILPASLSFMRVNTLRVAGITMPSAHAVGIGSMRDNLLGYGADGIARGIPFQSVSEMGTALGELLPINRLGNLDFEVPHLPMVQISRMLTDAPSRAPVREFLGRAGSEYLNYVFGFTPLVGDLRDLLNAVSNSEKLLSEFSRRFEKSYRFRNTQLEDDRTFTGKSTSETPTQPSLVTSMWDGSYKAQLEISGRIQERVWTSGEFLYHRFVTGEILSQVREWAARADYLLGLRPDVEMGWELLPFSWLVDWQTNIGSVLKNVSYIGRDGLALRYAYAMHEYTVLARVVNPISLKATRGPISASLTLTAKSRIKATPYGFGITPSSLTAKQWSILGALGLTSTFGKFDA